MNLEYIAHIVFQNGSTLYPDSVVGTDSHTTMINGLGVCGWGVGGIEAEAVMLGQPVRSLHPLPLNTCDGFHVLSFVFLLVCTSFRSPAFVFMSLAALSTDCTD